MFCPRQTNKTAKVLAITEGYLKIRNWRIFKFSEVCDLGSILSVFTFIEKGVIIIQIFVYGDLE